ncbi:MAG: SPFH domain-containing protein [Planctomycetota bacterium]
MSATRANKLTLGLGILLALILLLRLMVYVIPEGQVGVVLTFGRPSSDEPVAPGAGIKWPWPIQQVRAVDARLRTLQAPFSSVLTQDGTSVLVGSFLLWRVTSPQRFLELGSDAAAEVLLQEALSSVQVEAVGRVDFSALVNTDPTRLRYAQIEEDMGQLLRRALSKDGRDYGIEVAFVGIRRLGLAEKDTGAVFQRMRAERSASAEAILAEGRALASDLRAQADAERETALSAARGEAEAILSRAETEAREAYAVLAEEPELAIYLKKSEALKKLLQQRTLVVFDTTQPPFDLLQPDAAAVDSSSEGGK